MSGAIAGRMACLLAAALLACASTAHGQVIEEDGFPVKEGGAWGESFSLSCPPRLYAPAGESVAISCSATGVPEEGVRYEWEAVPGDGLRLLSDAQALAPLFAASLSGGAEYAYRLTVTGPGVYATASVTVTVEGVSVESVRGPVVQEECDPFTIPDELGKGCVQWEGAPDPFGFGSEEEGGFLLPEAPGVPDRPGGFDSRTPPRLECPVAVFLEELETGQVECQAWDASGEEYLEYSWEPVGSTTRDYLDNPRLLPENSPTPLVIAPETPSYETLESFRSGDRTFRYRYRLTAISRATGLSSFSEVEVYVSSSRPSVYCPLEIVAEEGETVSLDCEGVDPLSFRMDYDEDEASVLWEWEGLWGTSTAFLEATELSSPLFTAPPGSAGKEYHYIASMTTSASGVPHTARRRVTIRVVEGGEGAQIAENASVPTRTGSATAITCNDSEVYEATADFTLDCSVTDEPSDATYAWTARGSTTHTNDLSSTTILTPTFSVPTDINESGDADKDYEYTVTMSATGIDNISEDVTVTVLEKPDILIGYQNQAGPTTTSRHEGASPIQLPFNVSGLSGAPGPNPVYTSVWSTLGDTPDEALAFLNPVRTTVWQRTFFTAPDRIYADVEYRYRLTVSAANADPATDGFYVTVLNNEANDNDITVTCEDSPYEVDEGDADFDFDCSASGPPEDNSDYTWSWSPTTNLTDHNTATPTFAVPDDVNQDTTYTYTVTATADGLDDGTATVTVTVRNTDSTDPSLTCTDSEIYEGTADFMLNCTVENEPPGAAYSWTHWGSTTDTSLLTSGTNTLTPTFSVPDDVDADTDYDYLVRLSVGGVEQATDDVRVTVKDRPDITVRCGDRGEGFYFIFINEGDGDERLSCTASGAPGDDPDYTWSWSPTDGLTDHDTATPTFDVPDDVDQDTTWTYTVTASAANANDGAAEVIVRVRDTDPLLTCTDSEVYEGTADFTLNCSVKNEPSGASYVWTTRGSPGNTDDLSNTTILAPTFDVPDNIDADTDYEYTVTMSAPGVDDITKDVTVTVRKQSDITVTCIDNSYEVDEGVADFNFDCSASGAPDGVVYRWDWSPTTRLTNLHYKPGPYDERMTPIFDVPADVPQDTTYTYTATVRARGNAYHGTAEVTVTVRDTDTPDPSLTCTGSEVYEATADFPLNCSVTNEPTGATYAWAARGSTSGTSLLSSTTILAPTFDVPDDIPGVHTDDYKQIYTYTVTMSASDGNSAIGIVHNVAVTVLEKPNIRCGDQVQLATLFTRDEGAPDFQLNSCPAGWTRAPGANPVYTYAWTTRGSTANTDLLGATDIESPTFYVPDEVDENEGYTYTLTVSAENADDMSVGVSVVVRDTDLTDPVITCNDAEVYEGTAGFTLDCSVTDEPPGATYAWTARGSTSDTDDLGSTTILKPTFDVPDNVDADTDYEYTLTLSASGINDVTEDVTVTVLNKLPLTLICAPVAPVYEGAEDFDLDCVASGAPSGSTYDYVWTARGSTVVPGQLSSATIEKPTFDVPEEMDSDQTYEYTLTVSADNAESATEDVTVTVLNKKALEVTCATPSPVYEESEDFAFDCVASGAPAGSEYAYVWTARGGTTNTDLLVSGTDGPTPTFDVPEQLDSDETYEYLLTVSAENAEDGTAKVTVKVLNFGSIALLCASSPLVYEGSEDFALDCSILGDTGGADYTYEWTARDETENTDLLSATNISSPTFYVPDEVDETTTYEYWLTARAANVEDATAAITVTVLNRGALDVACAPPPLVYEGSEDFALDCSASGGPAGSDYAYVWTVRGDTQDTSLLSATDIESPTFYVPATIEVTATYEYLLTVSAENAEDGLAAVTVTVLNQGRLRVVCADPPSIYEGSDDIAFDCEASGGPAGSEYTYAWTAQGSTANTDLLSAVDISSPTFHVPDEVDETKTYEYLLTVSAENAEDGLAAVTVTVLDKPALAVECTDLGSVYEGSDDIQFDCTASYGGINPITPSFAWSGSRLDLLSDSRLLDPTFYVPDQVESNETYEYTLTASADNAEDATANVTVTVLNKPSLALVCTPPAPVYEGAEDFALDCSASGAPAGSDYTYAWTAQGDTENTLQLSATDIPSPIFYVPDAVDETTDYEYLLTVSAENAEDGSAAVTVTVLDRAPLVLDDAIAGRVYIFTVGEIIEDILLPQATGGLSPYTYTLEPVLPRGLRLKVDGDTKRTISGTPLVVRPRTKYTWQVTDANAETAQIAFFIEVAPAADTTSPPVAESSPELPEPSALGVTVSASPLHFGVQSADTEVSLDPMTDLISTYVSGPYHAGRMTLAPGGSEATGENGEMDLSIELASPVVLKRADAIEASSLVLSPNWSYAASCEQLSSQAVGGLYTEVTLSEDACRLLRFGGELDLTDAPSGQYTGNLDIVLRSGESEETFAVEVTVTVVPARRMITIGPGGVRFSTSREAPAGLTEEQNLSIYPSVAFLTEENPHGVFELSNPSLIPLEVSVSARFGYTEATETGREAVVEDTLGSRLDDLSEVVDIHPGVLVLMPGDKGLIRYGVKEGALAAMTEKGYAAFFDVVSEPRLYVRTDQMAEEISDDRTARVTMRVPGVYVPGEGASQLHATLLSISFVGSMSATFLLETTDHPFVGEVVAYDGDGRELGRRETLVYTRSRVRVPLDRIPEEGTVFLRFAPRGSGRAPLPTSVEWNTSPRDIGDAGKEGRTMPPATLVRKP